MFRLAGSILSRIGTLALVGYIAWAGWENLGPSKPEIGPIRKDLADRIIPNIVEDIRNARGDIREAVLLHFANDPTDYFTDALRRAIEQGGTLDLRDRAVSEKLRNMLNLRHPSYPSMLVAIEHGRDLNTRGVLYGEIRSFESYRGGATIDVEVNLADISTGQNVFSKRYAVETTCTCQPGVGPLWSGQPRRQDPFRR
jgi:hypothetical protein